MIKLERTIEQYRNGLPSVIVEGSKAQVLFALEDGKTDVLRLAAHVDRLEAVLRELTEACETDCGVPTENDGDDEPVGAGKDDEGNVKPMALTFGMLRRARRALGDV